MESSKQSLKDSVENLQSKIDAAREQNSEQLIGARLELIQLMEQGDQVVKSPWSSWQFGANYIYSNWRSKYKGRGDKAEKYPFEGIFARDVDEFNRYVPTTSDNYSLLTKSSDPRSAASNARDKVSNYGLASNIPVPEPPVVTEVNAGINPKNINKVPLNIVAKTANSPVLPEPVKFEPINPKINIPAEPDLPDPPEFRLYLGPDSNWQDGVFNDRGAGAGTKPSFYNANGTIDGRSKQNVMYHLSYTLDDKYTTDFKFDTRSAWTAFKMWADDGAVLGAYDLEYDDTTKKVRAKPGSLRLDSKDWVNPLENLPNDIYFNSYNFSYNGGTSEFDLPIDLAKANGSTHPQELNNQRFFVGGSRFIEMDIQGYNSMKLKNNNTYYPDKRTVLFPNGKTLHLAGPLTLGMVSQENGLTFLNQGKITDDGENTEQFVINTPNEIDLNVPLGTLKVKKSDEGFLGYKVGIAQVAENTAQSAEDFTPATPTNVQPMINEGVIDFKGPNSMGMYVYLYRTSNGVNPEKGSKAQLTNKGQILLHGKESYGMRVAAYSKDEASMVNDTTGKISLGVNGRDKADNSVAMAIMYDGTIKDPQGATFPTGRAINKGEINLTGVKNSVGTFVNIDSDITNDTTGKINISSNIDKTTVGNKQPFNIGMRSGKIQNAEVINNGQISLDGSYGIGMLANGSKLTNTGTITTTANKTILNGIGIVGMEGAIIANSGTIKLTGTGDTNNIGVFLNSGSKGTTVTGTTTKSSIEMTGDNSTGILVTGKNNAGASELTTDGTVKVSGNSVTGIVANGTTVSLNGTGTVTVDNNGDVSSPIGAKGSYGIIVTKDKNTGLAGKFEGADTTVNVKVTNPESMGLYSEGDLKVKTANVVAREGAINFFASNGGTIDITGGGTTETGQKSLLFYTGKATTTGKVILGGTMNATIKGGTTPSTRGTAFYYVSPTRYGAFNTSAIQNYFNSTFGNGTSTLNNLNLTMEAGSRLFVASDVGMNLSDTGSTNLMSGISGAPTINGSDYKTFMLYLSKLTINQAVNLDDSNDAYNRLEIANSSIDNTNNMSGSQNRQVAIAQENGNDENGNGYNASEVTLKNTATGVINLTGEETTGIYAKRGKIENAGNISVGNKSTAIYLVEDDRSPAVATEGAIASNTGTIKVGENSTGIYYKIEPDNIDGKGANIGVAGGISNAGRIESTANNVMAMSFDSPYTSKSVENKAGGIIDLQGQNSTGMYTVGTGTYTATNNGTIKLASSSNANTPNIGMYTDKSAITLDNNGTIEGGDKTVGIYGYSVNLGSSATTKVGAGGTGIYSQGGNVTLNGGTLSVGENGTVGSNDAVGVYVVGASGGTITNNATNVKIGDSAYGFVVQNENGAAVTLNTNTPNVTLGNDAVYAYSNNRVGSITNTTTLNATGSENYGIYGAGTVINNADINFGLGIGNVGIYSILGGTATNNSTITIGASDAANEKFGIGMAAGYKTTDSGNIINSSTGVINVTGKDSIGMYATGASSTATNKGIINLSGEKSVGMYLDNGATGINEGTITTTGSAAGVKAVVLSGNSKLINRAGAKIHVDSEEGFGIFRVNTDEANITVVNYGDITVGGGAKVQGEFDPTGGKELEKTAGGVILKAPKGTNDINITVNGKPAPNVEKVTTPVGNRGDALISSIGMYVDTLRGTNPINGLSRLSVKKAELLYGVEAAQNSNSKYFEISGDILKPYQDAVRNAQGIKWSHSSASFTWLALPTVDGSGVPLKVAMAKIPYTEFAGNEATPVDKKDTYNFLDGLEQRYGVEAVNSKEKELFNKLNGIGNNEATLFYQATDEMMGHQYANVQQRVQATGIILDKEFDYLRGEWRTASKDSNKIKTFGTRGEYRTDTAGVIDYKYHAYGVAYVHENEDIKLGRGVGWYAGIVHNTFKFKDIGNSKEQMLQGKVGLYKSIPFDDNNSLNWTISGDIFAGYNRMHRKFLVVDEIFNAKAKYYTYGIGIKNEIGKEFRLSEDFSLRPYAALGLEYGRVSKIREKSGEIKLEVKQNDYISVKPEVGAELAFKHYFGMKALRTSLGVAYENELGRVAKGKNKARVRNTSADWFNIRGEKEDRRGNVKFDLNVGLDNTRVGVNVNAGYDTKGHNVRGGLGLRVIF
ncbi:autotransporter-associated N-terminal domain-containing protein [Fusobacterium sp. 1001295B_180824_G3]|uniref:autotransporter-associated N-terminal domain-containing protein n=2 Tax=Fusobacterium TaxID=848 RepID=UPI00351CAB64